jgi:hypothetical protein
MFCAALTAPGALLEDVGRFENCVRDQPLSPGFRPHAVTHLKTAYLAETI